MPEPSETNKSATDRVKEWLQTKGVRLELDVAAEFRDLLTDVDHSRYYLDSKAEDGPKVREIDVLAQCTTRTYDQNAFVSTWFVVECKSSDKHPWVLYRSRSVSDFSHRDSFAFVRDMLTTAERGATVSDLAERLIWDASGTVWAEGKYAYQVTDTGRNEAFTAVRQALSSVEGARADFADEPGRRTLGIFVPVLVTAAPLFTVDVVSGRNYEVNPATWVPLIGRFTPSDYLRLVWVVQAESAHDYVQEAVKGAAGLRFSHSFDV